LSLTKPHFDITKEKENLRQFWNLISTAHKLDGSRKNINLRVAQETDLVSTMKEIQHQKYEEANKRWRGVTSEIF
jgi:hypothetical protein